MRGPAPGRLAKTVVIAVRREERAIARSYSATCCMTRRSCATSASMRRALARVVGASAWSCGRLHLLPEPLRQRRSPGG